MAFDFLYPNEHWHFMRSKTELPELLYLSSSSVRKLASRYIKKFAIESDEAFSRRIEESILIPFFTRTIDTIVNKTFENGFMMNNWGEREKSWLIDINYLGLDVTTFFRIFYRNAWIYGLNSVLVSFPSNPTSFSYPFLTEISPPNLYNWEFREAEGNRSELFSITYVTNSLESTERIQLTLEPGYLVERLWVQRNSKEENSWFIAEENQILGFNGEPLNSIPLFTFYVNYISPLVAVPPLEELALINLQHFRSYSLYSNLLDTVNIPILIAKGLLPPENPNFYSTNDSRPPINIAANDILFTDNSNADIRFVEHSGTSLQAALDKLKYLESAAEKASYELLSTNVRTGNITATEVLLESGKTLTTIQHSAHLFNKFLARILTNGYTLFVDPIKAQIGELQLLVPTMISKDNFDRLLTLYDKGLVPESLVLSEAKKQGIIPDDWEPPA